MLNLFCYFVCICWYFVGTFFFRHTSLHAIHKAALECPFRPHPCKHERGPSLTTICKKTIGIYSAFYACYQSSFIISSFFHAFIIHVSFKFRSTIKSGNLKIESLFFFFWKVKWVLTHSLMNDYLSRKSIQIVDGDTSAVMANNET